MRYRGEDAGPGRMRGGCGGRFRGAVRGRAGLGAAHEVAAHPLECGGGAGGGRGLSGTARPRRAAGPAASRGVSRSSGAGPPRPGPLAGLGGAGASPGGTWEGGIASPGRTGASPSGTWEGGTAPSGRAGASPGGSWGSPRGAKGSAPGSAARSPSPFAARPGRPFPLPHPAQLLGAAGTRRNLMLSSSFKRHNGRKLSLE